VLAVKPQQLKGGGGAVPRQARHATGGKHRRRTAHGDISRWLGGYNKLVRTMPNTPALIGAGVTGLCADPSVDLEGRSNAEKILGGGQHGLDRDEEQMDAVTAVSGSGPAYVFYFLEAMEAAAAISASTRARRAS
jgi:pyrroline-5-carboxylate reductase